MPHAEQAGVLALRLLMTCAVRNDSRIRDESVPRWRSPKNSAAESTEREPINPQVNEQEKSHYDQGVENLRSSAEDN